MQVNFSNFADAYFHSRKKGSILKILFMKILNRTVAVWNSDVYCLIACGRDLEYLFGSVLFLDRCLICWPQQIFFQIKI